MVRTYGIGLINNKALPREVVATRPSYLHGLLNFVGFKSVSPKKVFHAGSGSHTLHGVPYGTYILTPQATGSTILSLYRRFNLHGPGLEMVYNVGVPGAISVAGFDPALNRKRSSIQMHCEPKLMSAGCIVQNEVDFKEFIRLSKIASLEHKLDLVVMHLYDDHSPSNAKFTIVPRI